MSTESVKNFIKLKKTLNIVLALPEFCVIISIYALKLKSKGQYRTIYERNYTL